jgi:hypothetical protein
MSSAPFFLQDKLMLYWDAVILFVPGTQQWSNTYHTIEIYLSKKFLNKIQHVFF